MIKEYVSAKELIGLPFDEKRNWPGTERSCLRKADALNLPKRQRAGTKAWEYRVEAMPEATQMALQWREVRAERAAKAVENSRALSESRSEELWDWYVRRPGSLQAEARRRLPIVHELANAVEDGLSFGAALRCIAVAHDLSDDTLRRWWTPLQGHHRSDWLPLLIPHHPGRTATAPCSDEAWEFFKADYLRLEQPNAAACYERLKRAAAEHQWEIPSLKTLQRRIHKMSRSARILLRDGESALLHTYPAQRRDVYELRALEWVNGDGYQHNVFVKWPDGSIARPKTWFWQDVYSRKMLAWRTDTTEHTELVRLSFGDLVEKYGIPTHATIDNTRAAANKWMTGGMKNRYRFKVKEEEPIGIFLQLGVQVHWTSVFKGKGHGQAKPIERAFGIGGIGEVVDKHPTFKGAWTGNQPTAKPEDYGSRAIPLETFQRILAEEVHAWNIRVKRRTEICGSVLSFEQAFTQSYERAVIKKATDNQRRLWLLTAENVTVQRDGSVTLDAGALVGQGRNRYYSGELVDHVGQAVIVRFDPQSLHGEVYCYQLDGNFIAAAVCIENAGFGDIDAGREHNRARRSYLKAIKEQVAAEQQMDALEIARLLPGVPETAGPTASVIKPAFTPPIPTVAPELRAQAQAALAAANAVPVTESITPAERYRRWQELDVRLRQNGGDLMNFSEWERHWYSTYPTCVEFRTQKLLAENPAPVPGQQAG